MAALALAGPATAQTDDTQQRSGPGDGWLSKPVAVLQGLHKVTARISTIHAPVGQTAEFGALRITPRTCEVRPPEEQPESAAFLEITEITPEEEGIEVFSGWMFASSPALSAMDHAVYDVWVLDCVDPDSEAQGDEEG